MGLLSPGPGQKPHRAKNATSEDELTDAAEIVIMLFPADSSSASDADAKDAGDTATLPARIGRLIRRIGLQARVTVPASDAGEMLGFGRLVAWVFLVLGTLAIVVPAGMTPRNIITVIALELAGFIIETLARRRRRKNT